VIVESDCKLQPGVAHFQSELKPYHTQTQPWPYPKPKLKHLQFSELNSYKPYLNSTLNPTPTLPKTLTITLSLTCRQIVSIYQLSF